ncbi:Acyl-CoA-binding domain-containing protein 4, partial [Choanephora cucurbitarum]
MATAQRNSSLIMFGGETPLSTFNNSNMYELTQTSNSFDWRTINQVNAPPGNIYGQAVVSSDQNRMYLLGGMTNATDNREVPFQYYTFNFQNNSWTAAPTNTNATNMPLNRKLFSATYDNANKIYIYGGALNSTAIFNNFFSFDISTNQFTPLASPNVYRFGHTASYLSNGKIVVIGGSAQIVQNQTTLNTLVPMSTIHVYDIASNTWEEKTATAVGTMPSTRHVHNAVVTSDNKIIVFGGDNNEQIRNKAYLNQVAVLDTNTWQWSLPSIQGIPPSRRSYASGGLVGNNLVVAFGSGYNTYYNDINVLNLNTMSWLQSFDSSTGSGSSGLSGGAIAGISIACVVVLVIILFLLWKFQKYARWLVQRIHRDIWKPRTGEPLWAETTRIVCQIFLLFIFFIFLAFVIRQAINSPNVTQKIVKSVPEVQVPDVRFCFDGFPLYPSTDIRTPGVSCSTDTGYSCTQFVQPLNMSVFQPTFTDNLGAVSCVLFTAPKTFTLTSTSGSNNGSRLLFTMFGDQNAPQARVHVSVY